MAVATVDDAGEFKEVTEGVSEEKLAIFGRVSLGEPIFGFFLFLESTGDCEVATQVE